MTTLEAQIVLKELHEGVATKHLPVDIIAKKILNGGYWWPILFKDTHDFCRSCDNLSKNWSIKNKKSGQVDNNTFGGTFYEMGFRFYRSNKTSKKTNMKQIYFGN